MSGTEASMRKRDLQGILWRLLKEASTSQNATVTTAASTSLIARAPKDKDTVLAQ